MKDGRYELQPIARASVRVSDAHDLLYFSGECSSALIGTGRMGESTSTDDRRCLRKP